LTLAPGAVDIRTLRSEKDRPALLLGAEGTGLTDEAVARADLSVVIPMARGVDSLNVGAAAAVAFWELCR
jgi:tRNA G18 (ribose-2'-O)-methylase SpoU